MGQLKYAALAEVLRRGIRDGRWPPGARLPTEAALAAEHGLSVNTVRRAMEELVGEGCVERRQGAGTFVRALPRTARGARRTIAVLVPERRWYFPPVLAGAEAAAARARTAVAVHTTGYGDDGWDRLARIAAAADGVDGLVLTHPGPLAVAAPERVRWLHGLPLPYVLLERTPAGVADACEHVSSDLAGGVYLALEHLARLGHRGVALVCLGGSPPSVEIARGFEEGVAALGLRAAARFDWPMRRVPHLRASVALRPLAEAALRAVRESGATAVVCFGEMQATLLVEAARRAGLRVPGDLAVVSCEDSSGDGGGADLTSVAPEKFRLGRLAVETLLRRLDEPDAELRRVWLRPRLVVRGTCGADGGGAPAGPGGAGWGADGSSAG